MTLVQEAPPGEQAEDGVLAQIQRQIREIANPLVAQLKDLDAEIVAKEREVRDLKGARQALRSVVRGIDPSLVEPLYQTNGKKKKKGGWQRGKKSFGENSVEMTIAWLQDHKEELNGLWGGEGFRPIDIYTREDWGILKSTSAVSALLGKLHEDGVVRLNKWVKGKPFPNRPTGKFYKVV